MQRMAANVALIILSLGFTLVVAEVGLHVVSSDSGKRTIHVDNMEYAYEASYNAEGYRDREYGSPHKEPGMFRLILIGDSFVVGTGISSGDRIGSLVERHFNMPDEEVQQGKPNVQVVTAGKAGVGIHEYVRISQEMTAFDGDAIVLAFFVDNDIATGPRPLAAENGWSFRLPSLAKRAGSALLQKYIFACSMPSSLFQYLGRVIDLHYRSEFCRARINGWILPRSAYGASYGGENGYYRALADTFNDTAWTRSALLRIKEIFGGRQFLVLLIPSYHQVSPDYFVELRKVGFIYESYSVPVTAAPQKAIKAFLTDKEISCIDLLEPLRSAEASTGMRHYYSIDGHFNAAGARVAAEAIVAWLEPIYRSTVNTNLRC